MTMKGNNCYSAQHSFKYVDNVQKRIHENNTFTHTIKLIHTPTYTTHAHMHSDTKHVCDLCTHALRYQTRMQPMHTCTLIPNTYATYANTHVYNSCTLIKNQFVQAIPTPETSATTYDPPLTSDYRRQ